MEKKNKTFIGIYKSTNINSREEGEIIAAIRKDLESMGFINISFRTAYLDPFTIEIRALHPDEKIQGMINRFRTSSSIFRYATKYGQLVRVEPIDYIGLYYKSFKNLRADDVLLMQSKVDLHVKKIYNHQLGERIGDKSILKLSTYEKEQVTRNKDELLNKIDMIVSEIRSDKNRMNQIETEQREIRERLNKNIAEARDLIAVNKILVLNQNESFVNKVKETLDYL